MSIPSPSPFSYPHLFLLFFFSCLRLNLADNKIGFEGSQAIGRMLGFNATLAELDYRNNKLGKKGGESFGKGIKANKVISNK